MVPLLLDPWGDRIIIQEGHIRSVAYRMVTRKVRASMKGQRKSSPKTCSSVAEEIDDLAGKSPWSASLETQVHIPRIQKSAAHSHGSVCNSSVP